jgi:hypothetical protein
MQASISHLLTNSNKKAFEVLTGGEHGIEQEHPSIGNILGKLVVEELWLRGFLITLD